MKYDQISYHFFLKNRKKFIEKLPSNSIAIFHSDDFYGISHNTKIRFEKNCNLFYLCGINQNQTILLIFPNAVKEEFREILFIRRTNNKIRIWEGNQLSKNDATLISGIKTIFWIDELQSILYSLIDKVEILFLNINKCSKYYQNEQKNEFIEIIKKHYPLHQYRRSNIILQSLRSIKEPEELEYIKKAISITEQGFMRVLKFIQPNIWEFEIEAEFIHEFIKLGSLGFSYLPIIASGKNNNILHYTDNSKQCQAGELLLLDVGVEYSNYCSDITRTIPVCGRFSKRQKEIYKSVLSIKKYAESLLFKGNNLENYENSIGKFVTEELLKLELLNKFDIRYQSLKDSLYKKFFMHKISHHLGLEVHDCQDFFGTFEENMVLTIEPGIYISNENIGIRLEDNYVIQKKGNPINLSNRIPIECEEIEYLMNTK